MMAENADSGEQANFEDEHPLRTTSHFSNDESFGAERHLAPSRDKIAMSGIFGVEREGNHGLDHGEQAMRTGERTGVYSQIILRLAQHLSNAVYMVSFPTRVMRGWK
jgi:hypothetical protein